MDLAVRTDRIPDEHAATGAVVNEIGKIAELQRAAAAVEYFYRIDSPEIGAVDRCELLRPELVRGADVRHPRDDRVSVGVAMEIGEKEETARRNERNAIGAPQRVPVRIEFLHDGRAIAA